MASPFSNISPVVKNLLIINFICFLPFIFLNEAQYSNLVVSHFGVFYFASPLFKPWQIITYMFLHGGWEHILFNMFALFSFGPILEYTIGSKKFFNLYFICGIGAVLFQMIVQAIEIHYYTGAFTMAANTPIYSQAALQQITAIYYGPVVGASGAIFGVLVAFGILFPNLELMILFIPVPIKAKYIIPLYIIFEIFSSTGVLGSDNVAHLAHLGGALIAFILIKIWDIKRPNGYY